MSARNILVTGGAGFIGSHLVDALVAAGHRVRVLDNFDPQVHEGKRPDYLNAGAEYLEGDVRDRRLVDRALERIEVVFHEAAAVGVGQSMYQVERYMAANTIGTAVLLEALIERRQAVRKLIVASSMSIYGEGQYRCAACGPVTPGLRPLERMERHAWEVPCPRCGQACAAAPTREDKPLIPTSVYAISKRDQEELCLTVGRSYSLPTVALRYFNAYGPRQSLSNPYTGVCAIFSSRIKNGHRPLVFEDGGQTRDFIHVQDIVQANILVMGQSQADYGVFNVGSGQAVPIAQIGQLLAQLYGSAITPDIVGKFRVGDIRHCYADTTRLRQLGFVAQVGFEDGLRDLVAWGQETAAEDRVETATTELLQRGLTRG